MDNDLINVGIADVARTEEESIDLALGEELTDEQLLQMAEGSCSWGASCNRGC